LDDGAQVMPLMVRINKRRRPYTAWTSYRYGWLAGPDDAPGTYRACCRCGQRYQARTTDDSILRFCPTV
jgi:hypothetical protein